MKVWSGSAWAEKPAKVWNGSAWVAKPVKVWSGSAWVVKPPVATGFQDSFNRSDADLGSSLTASGGWAWTLSGTGSAAQIRSNVLRANTTVGDGSYFTKDIATAEHYVQFKALSTSGVGPFVIARHADANNQIGIRLNGANIQIYRRVSSTYTNFHDVNYGFAVNDVVKVKFTGNTCQVFKNGVSQATGIAIGATLSGTKCGLNPRQALQDPWLDDFEAGAN